MDPLATLNKEIFEFEEFVDDFGTVTHNKSV
jgi:hypothetical protein